MLRELLLYLGDCDCIVGETRGGAPCGVKIHRIKPNLRYVNLSGKMIVDPHPAPGQHQKLITSRGSFLADLYHVWSTPVTAIVSYPAHRQNDKTNHRPNITPPALAE